MCGGPQGPHTFTLRASITGLECWFSWPHTWIAIKCSWPIKIFVARLIRKECGGERQLLPKLWLYFEWHGPTLDQNLAQSNRQSAECGLARMIAYMIVTVIMATIHLPSWLWMWLFLEMIVNVWGPIWQITGQQEAIWANARPKSDF